MQEESAGRRRPLIFILIALCLLFLASYTARLAQLRRLQNELATLEQRALDVQVDARRLDAELALVTSDAYVEQIAIEELNMAREGETVIVLADAPQSLALAAPVVPAGGATREPAAAAPPGEPAVWQQWWAVFR